MTQRADWVEPLAQTIAKARDDIVQVVDELPDDAWSKTSDYSGWTYKDHVSHLAESHRNVHDVMRAVIAGRDPDFSRFLKIDEINEENRQKHLATSVDALRTTFIAASEETESILGSLNAEHADFRLGPMTLGQAIQGFTMHDPEHLSQLRKALTE